MNRNIASILLKILLKNLYPVKCYDKSNIIEPGHEISNNAVCATSQDSDLPVHKPSLIRIFASRLNIYFMSVKLLTEHNLNFLSLKGGCTGQSEPTIVKMSHCLKSHFTAHMYLH